MTRVYSFGCQLPGMYGFKCPKCGNIFNIASEQSGGEIKFTCPGCKEKLQLIMAADPKFDPALRSDLKRVKPLGKPGKSGQPMYVYECPHCGNADIVWDQSAVLGMQEEEEEYVAQCLKCGKEYIRETT